MELMKMTTGAEYRLLMFQPNPESGERICVGVAFADDLLYDVNSSRLRSFAQDFPISILLFYLKDIREQIRRSEGGSCERLMKDYAPTFVFSTPRKLMRRADESTKLMLLNHHVTRNLPHHPQTDARQELSDRLEHLASKVAHPSDRIIKNAKPSDVFGEHRRGLGKIKPVAVAVKKRNHTLLLDGVDFNLLDPKGVIASSTRVVHTFWQYGRAERPYGEILRRIAVVFNGASMNTENSRDAHAFVLEQFKNSADETVETQADHGEERLTALLA